MHGMYEYDEHTVHSIAMAKKNPDTSLWTQHQMPTDYQAVIQHSPHDQH